LLSTNTPPYVIYTLSLHDALPILKSGKIDFTHSFRNKIKMEAGIKASVVTSDNNVKYLNYKDKEWITDKGTSNHFIYTENINARSEEHTSELQSRFDLVCRLLLEK